MVISFLPVKYKREGTFMENTCNFVGYVRHLSDLNESSKGNRYCRFTLENINHGYHNFIRMIVFGNKAEKFIDEISEAQLIYVVCEMQINVFEGQVRYNFMLRDYCILQVKSAEKCNDFLHSLAAHFLFYLVI